MKNNKKTRGLTLFSIASKPDFPRHLEKLLRSNFTDIDDIEFRNKLFKTYIEAANRGFEYTESQREKSQKPRNRFSTDNEVLNKKILIQRALSAAGEGANTHSVMSHLFGILEKEGMQPNFDAAKKYSVITATDAEDRPLKFTYTSVQKTLTQLRTSGAPRGRPRIKQN